MCIAQTSERNNVAAAKQFTWQISLSPKTPFASTPEDSLALQRPQRSSEERHLEPAGFLAMPLRRIPKFAQALTP
jgi:hypothetical protein